MDLLVRKKEKKVECFYRRHHVPVVDVEMVLLASAFGSSFSLVKIPATASPSLCESPPLVLRSWSSCNSWTPQASSFTIAAWPLKLQKTINIAFLYS